MQSALNTACGQWSTTTLEAKWTAAKWERWLFFYGGTKPLFPWNHQGAGGIQHTVGQKMAFHCNRELNSSIFPSTPSLRFLNFISFYFFRSEQFWSSKNENNLSKQGENLTHALLNSLIGAGKKRQPWILSLLFLHLVKSMEFREFVPSFDWEWIFTSK